jgi:hypothetical protein
MAIDEAARLRLYEQAREAYGDDAASTLMAGLSWDTDQLATRDDLALLRGDLRSEMAELRGELRSEMAELRGELRSEMAELRGEMGELRGDMGGLRGEMGELRGGMRAAVADGVRTMVFATVASNATIAGVIVAALQLG